MSLYICVHLTLLHFRLLFTLYDVSCVVFSCLLTFEQVYDVFYSWIMQFLSCNKNFKKKFKIPAILYF